MNQIADFYWSFSDGVLAPSPRISDMETRPFGPHGFLFSYPSQNHFHSHIQNDFRAVLIGRLYRYGPYRGNEKNLLPIVARNWHRGQFNPADLNGSFVLFFIEDTADDYRLSIITDRLGTHHAYFSQEGNSLCLGTCFAQLASSLLQPQLDWEGISQFCTLGYFMENRSYFQQIKIIPAATIWSAEIKGATKDKPYIWIKEKSYWNWKQQSRSGTFEDAVEDYNQVLTEVLEDRFGQDSVPLVMGVSGGLDSRNLLGLCRYYNGIRLYTYGYEKESVEIDISRQLADVCDLPISEYVIHPNLGLGYSKVLDYSEGFSDITQARQSSVLSQLARTANRGIIGQWGDVWNDSPGLDPADFKSDYDYIKYAANKYKKRGAENLWPELERYCDGKSIEEILFEGAQRELEKIQVDDINFRLTAYKTWQWSFRNTIVGANIFRMGFEPYLPFYDNRIVDFFQTLPQTWVRDRKLQLAWHVKYAPELARVKWQETGCNLFVSRQQARRYTFFKRGFKYLQRKAGLAAVTQRNWETQFQNMDLLADLKAKNENNPYHQFSDSLLEKLALHVKSFPSAENGYAASIMFSVLSTLQWLGTKSQTPLFFRRG